MDFKQASSTFGIRKKKRSENKPFNVQKRQKEPFSNRFRCLKKGEK